MPFKTVNEFKEFETSLHSNDMVGAVSIFNLICYYFHIFDHFIVFLHIPCIRFIHTGKSSVEYSRVKNAHIAGQQAKNDKESSIFHHRTRMFLQFHMDWESK